MNNKLFYGNGICSIEGDDIKTVHIKFEGAVEINDKTPSSHALMSANNGIIIFPIGSGQSLSELFTYKGRFKIKRAFSANGNGVKSACLITKVMDYSELLGIAESLTINSEDMNSTHTYGRNIKKTRLIKRTIPALHTKSSNLNLFLDDGRLYNGYYHIYLEDGGAMTGKDHNAESKNLYIKQSKNGVLIDKLISTKNLSGKPKVTRILKRRKKR